VKFVQVSTTTAREEDAQRIADALVAQRLAGCVQILGPIRSTFRWQDRVDTAQEWICLVKSREDLYARVEAAIKANHSYEVPEILCTPVTAGSAEYLGWLDSVVG